MCIISKKIFNSMFIKNPNATHDNDNNIDDPNRDKLMGPHFDEYVATKIETQEKFGQLPFEILNMKTDDGLNLVGRLYRNPKPSQKTAVLIHGYNSYGIREYCYTGFKYIEAGYNLFLPDNRGCGDSEGKYFTFGLKESEDVKKWLAVINTIFPKGEIILQGSSLGGATVLMLSNQDLPKNVKAIVSDCSYSTMTEEFKYMAKNIVGLPAFPILQFVEMYFKRYTGCDFTSKTPMKSVKESKLPILFIHGEADRFIPKEQCQKLYDACTSEKELLYVPEAGHVGAYVQGKDKYFNTVFNFLAKYLSK